MGSTAGLCHIIILIGLVHGTSGNNASLRVDNDVEARVLPYDPTYGLKLRTVNDTATEPSHENQTSHRSGRKRYFQSYNTRSTEDSLPVVIVGRQKDVSNRPENLASDIRCMKVPTRESLTALLTLPPGYDAPPIMQTPGTHRGSKANTCKISRRGNNVYGLEVTNLNGCGVIDCQGRDGKSWLCLDVRFPRMRGLRLPEDLVITIQCRPQDPTIARDKTLTVASQDSNVKQRSLGIISGGEQHFECEIGLFRQLPGTRMFTSRVLPGSVINLGEELQLRSIVRSGDGWNFAQMTDVKIHRSDGSVEEVARLVGEDGCRAPRFKLIAPDHPARASRNSLINNFNFRAFMFENMQSGDGIRISCRVSACVEAIECAPAICGGDPDQKLQPLRRKRSPTNLEERKAERVEGNGTSSESMWEADIPITILLPGEGEELHVPTAPQCRTYQIATLCTSLLFCILSATIVFHLKIGQRWKKQKQKDALTGHSSEVDSSATIRTSSPISTSCDQSDIPKAEVTTTHGHLSLKKHQCRRARDTCRQRYPTICCTHDLHHEYWDVQQPGEATLSAKSASSLHTRECSSLNTTEDRYYVQRTVPSDRRRSTSVPRKKQRPAIGTPSTGSRRPTGGPHITSTMLYNDNEEENIYCEVGFSPTLV